MAYLAIEARQCKMAIARAAREMAATKAASAASSALASCVTFGIHWQLNAHNQISRDLCNVHIYVYTCATAFMTVCGIRKLSWLVGKYTCQRLGSIFQRQM